MKTDTGNPELSRLGRLDFAFVIAFLLPLVTILLLYDLEGRERREGRYEWLNTTSVNGRNALHIRAGARTLLLFAAVAVPFAVMTLISGTAISNSLGAPGDRLAAPVLVQHLSPHHDAIRPSTNGSNGTVSHLVIGEQCSACGGQNCSGIRGQNTRGGEILLAQREKINGAWDLPKAATMTPFVASYPEWQAFAEVTQPFEWKWYYAFHQMGDESVAADSRALVEGIARRDALMGWVALLSPPLAAERWLTRLAETDRRSHQRYIQCVRGFHAELRDFHYPMLFGAQAYSQDSMTTLPQYTPCG